MSYTTAQRTSPTHTRPQYLICDWPMRNTTQERRPPRRNESSRRCHYLTPRADYNAERGNSAARGVNGAAKTVSRKLSNVFGKFPNNGEGEERRKQRVGERTARSTGMPSDLRGTQLETTKPSSSPARARSRKRMRLSFIEHTFLVKPQWRPCSNALE